MTDWLYNVFVLHNVFVANSLSRQPVTDVFRALGGTTFRVSPATDRGALSPTERHRPKPAFGRITRTDRAAAAHAYITGRTTPTALRREPAMTLYLRSRERTLFIIGIDEYTTAMHIELV
jgi:hypothetical protein